jgi:hypothetical protein
VGRLEREAGGLHHPPGDDDHLETGVARPAKRPQRPFVQPAVLPHERAVEVGRDDANAARKVGREFDQPFGLPPVAFTT